MEFFKARILEWVAIPFSRGSSQPKYQTWVSCIAGRFFTIWATREALSFQSCFLLLDHIPFTLIHGLNFPGSYTILWFTASDYLYCQTCPQLRVIPALVQPLILTGAISITLHSSPVAYWTPTDLGGGALIIFQHCYLFAFSYCPWDSPCNITWVRLPFPSPVGLASSKLLIMPCLSWVALHCMAHSFIELHKSLHRDKAVIHEGV